MRYAIPVTLWTLVAVGLAVYFFNKPDGGSGRGLEITSSGVGQTEPGDRDVPQGAAIVSIPWKHLPDVDRFKLTDHNGDKFDSADLNGRPYVVSFFFASCPSFCRDLNNELDRVNSALKNTDIQFLTITVDPENDTVEKLGQYAEGYDAKPDRWAFLRGQKHQLKEIGEHTFNVIVDRDTHTDNILLVDKWGRYRDRFKWDQPTDMKRFVKVAKQLAAETEPPLDESFETRNVLAGYEHPDLANVPWIRDFHLTERSGKKFFSRDLIGEVWIGNFFFSSCPGICKEQNKYLRDLQNRLGEKAPRVVSITTDPTNDTPAHLRDFAKSLATDAERWLFCTGDSHLIKRIGAEFFKLHSSGNHHSSELVVVDRWGDVRGKFDWQEPKQEIEMLKLVEQLRAEDRPQRPVDPPRKKLDDIEELEANDLIKDEDQ